MEKITKEQWNAYRALQEVGVINMLDVKHGSKLTNMSEEDYKTIILNYAELKKKCRIELLDNHVTVEDGTEDNGGGNGGGSTEGGGSSSTGSGSTGSESGPKEF